MVNASAQQNAQGGAAAKQELVMQVLGKLLCMWQLMDALHFQLAYSLYVTVFAPFCMLYAMLYKIVFHEDNPEWLFLVYVRVSVRRWSMVYQIE